MAISIGQVQLGIYLAYGSASIFAQVSGNRTFQNIVKWIGVAISAHQIYNRPVSATAPTFGNDFAEKKKKFNWHKLVEFLPGVGAILNFMAQPQPKDKKKEQRHLDRWARALLKGFVEQSNKTGYELSIGLCRLDDGSYEQTDILDGNEDSAPLPDCKRGLLIAVFHTHGKWKNDAVRKGVDWNEEFSIERDRYTANLHALTMYLGTPKGKLKKFIPALGSNPYAGKTITLKP